VWIRGRVTNKETGRPVPAVVRYGAFTDNPHLNEAPGFRDSDSDRAEVRTAEDGSFTLLGLPGRGLLAVKAANREEQGRYVVAAGADEIQGPRFGDGFDTEPSGCDPVDFNTLVAVNPVRGAEAIVCDIVLDPGKTVTGTIVDSDGKPVKGASIDRVRGGRGCTSRTCGRLSSVFRASIRNTPGGSSSAIAGRISEPPCSSKPTSRCP
jgi:hypothetical protein